MDSSGPKRKREGGRPEMWHGDRNKQACFDVVEKDPRGGEGGLVPEFDWVRFSLFLTDVVAFTSRQYPYGKKDDRYVVQVLDRRPCPLALRGTVYEKEIRLDWTSADMKMSYKFCYMDGLLRAHDVILKEAFAHYNMDAREWDGGWTVVVWLPEVGKRPIHCVNRYYGPWVVV